MTDVFSFKTSDELGQKIRDTAESEFEGNLSSTLNKLIVKALNMENRFAFLEIACEALAYETGDYRCVFGRIGKTPDIKKLGKTETIAESICSACRKTKDLKERLTSLEKQLARGKVIHIPSCRRGGKLNEDMTELLCPEIGRWRPIKDRKKKTDPQPCHYRGSKPYKRCESIEWTQTVIKGKLPDGQNL